MRRIKSSCFSAADQEFTKVVLFSIHHSLHHLGGDLNFKEVFQMCDTVRDVLAQWSFVIVSVT